MSFLSKKEKVSIVDAEMLSIWLANFVALPQVKICIATGKIANQAQYLLNFGEIKITQISIDTFEFSISTNGNDGFTKFKRTYTSDGSTEKTV